ncbi:MAG: DUF3460 family protein [Bordetella sp.]|nr:MAG: DUF3460 family protein [Bordetella sp.]
MINNYKSEISLFLMEYKKVHPNLEKSQRDGRSRLWDKIQNSKSIKYVCAKNISQKSYVYYE